MFHLIGINRWEFPCVQETELEYVRGTVRTTWFPFGLVVR